MADVYTTPAEVVRKDGDQPTSCRVCDTGEGSSWDIAECLTCGSILGAFPQPRHSLAECVRSIRERLEEAHRAR